MNDSISPSRRAFGFRFSRLARQWRQTLDAELSSVGLTDATWVPLVHLEDAADGITLKELAQRVGVDASSLVRVIDIHVRARLIERRPDETDGRAKRLVLTSAGEARVREIREELTRAEAPLLQDLDDAEIEALLSGLEKIAVRLAEARARRQGDAKT